MEEKIFSRYEKFEEGYFDMIYMNTQAINANNKVNRAVFDFKNRFGDSCNEKENVEFKVLFEEKDPEFQYGFVNLLKSLFPVNQIQRGDIHPLNDENIYFEYINPATDYKILSRDKINQMFYQLANYFLDFDKINGLTNYKELKDKSSSSTHFGFQQKKTRKKSQKKNGNFYFKDFSSIRKNLDSIKNPSIDEFKKLFQTKFSKFFPNSFSHI